MPPIRSFTAPKPLKTERSHEENQERAYIAASRRSDRSLEARIESARRASEIHKRRTGRSLRVTEQDVINEEMYEEEDDDLPLQYRRLTAHLNTNSPDFNRRLAAYLSNQLAMRNALDQAIANTYGLQPNSAPPWSTAFQNSQQPWNPDQSQSQQSMQKQSGQNSVMSPQMMHSPSASYPPGPYPMFPPQIFQPSNLQSTTANATSVGQTQETASSDNGNSKDVPTGEKRRMSAPSEQPHKRQLLQNRTMSSSSIPESAMEDDGPGKSASAPPGDEGKPGPQSLPNASGNKFSSWNGNSRDEPDISPFTTTLPPETQMMLGFDPNTPFGWSYLGNGNNTKPHQMQFPGYGLTSNRQANNFEGMSQTLAPSMLDSTAQGQNFFNSQSDGGNDNVSSFQAGFDQMFGQQYANDFSNKFASFDASSTGPASGQVTPGDKEWATFIDTATWDDPSS